MLAEFKTGSAHMALVRTVNAEGMFGGGGGVWWW